MRKGGEAVVLNYGKFHSFAKRTKVAEIEKLKDTVVFALLCPNCNCITATDRK